MHNLPFDKPGRFYKGNLHCHSDRSDGVVSPAALVAAYRERGYSFVAVTDHFHRYGGAGVTDTRPFRAEDFTTLLGAELHGLGQENGAPWHIVAVGLPHDFAAPFPDETGPQIAERAASVGAFIGVAHPHWSGLTEKDARTLDAAHGVEIYNDTCALRWDRGEGWYLCDMLLAAGRRLTAYGADDAHFATPSDCFGAWVNVRAETLEPTALLNALKAGYFYSSQGPEIHDIAIVDNILRITCSAVRTIAVTGRGAGGPFVVEGISGTVTETVSTHVPSEPNPNENTVAATTQMFPLDAFANSYCRVTITDTNGKRAWSNPIWLV